MKENVMIMYIKHHEICLDRPGNSKNYLRADSRYPTKIWTRDLTIRNVTSSHRGFRQLVGRPNSVGFLQST